MVLEGERVAFGASGRNGGFCEASLTHGLDNGIQRFPAEIERIEQEGRENLAGIAEAIERYGIDCAWEATGTLVGRDRAPPGAVVPRCGAAARRARPRRRVPRSRRRCAPRSTRRTYLGGVWRKDGGALHRPGPAGLGLAAAAGAARRPDPRARRRSRAIAGRRRRGDLRTALGARCAPAASSSATNAFPPLVQRLRRYILPVYDYVLMTEPLGAERKAAIGWADRQGLADMTNQFHYYRLTADDRILWGGYDAIYHWNNAVDPQLERRDATYALLAEHFFETFPQLEGLRFTHPGAARSTRAAGSASFFGTGARRQRRLRRRLHRARRRRDAASAPASAWTCSTARETERDPTVARAHASRCRSRPSRCAACGVWLTRRALARADRRAGPARAVAAAARPRWASASTARVSAMETWDAITSRRNVRAYADRPIAPGHSIGSSRRGVARPPR